MFRERRFTDLGRAWLLLGCTAGITALWIPHPLPATLAAVLLATLLASALPGWWLRRAKLSAPLPLRLTEDEFGTLSCELKLRRFAPFHVALARVSAEGCEPAVARCALRGSAKGSLRWRMRGRVRGRVHALHICLETREPFGLWHHRSRRSVPCDLWILPAARRIRRRVLDDFLRRAPQGHERPDPSGPGEGEFHSVREFREGDPEKAVHPRLSARRGRKVLRLDQGAEPPRVRLVLDLEVASDADDVFQQVDFEEEVRFAAGLVHALADRGVPVSLATWDGRRLRSLTPDCSRDVFPVLAALTLIRPRSVDAADASAVEVQSEPPVTRVRTVFLHTGRGRTIPSGWSNLAVGSQDYFDLLEPERRAEGGGSGG